MICPNRSSSSCIHGRIVLQRYVVDYKSSRESLRSDLHPSPSRCHPKNMIHPYKMCSADMPLGSDDKETHKPLARAYRKMQTYAAKAPARVQPKMWDGRDNKTISQSLDRLCVLPLLRFQDFQRQYVAQSSSLCWITTTSLRYSCILGRPCS